MGVLHVVDGVLARLALRQLDVHVHVHVCAAAREVPARGVDPELGQQLVQGDERAGTLGHGQLLAVLQEVDPAREDDLDGARVEAHGLGGVAQSGNRPVVVCPPDVDQVVEASAELLGDVADVRREVGRFSVRANDDPILVIAEVGRAEPRRPVVLVQVAAVPESSHRPLDPAVGMQAALVRPHVEADTERGQRGLDPLPDALGGPATCRPGALVLRIITTGRCHDVLGHLAREIRHVVAVIAVLRHLAAITDCEYGRPKFPHLRARNR